jgi:hypothetical protein
VPPTCQSGLLEICPFFTFVKYTVRVALKHDTLVKYLDNSMLGYKFVKIIKYPFISTPGMKKPLKG